MYGHARYFAFVVVSRVWLCRTYFYCEFLELPGIYRDGTPFSIFAPIPLAFLSLLGESYCWMEVLMPGRQLCRLQIDGLLN